MTRFDEVKASFWDQGDYGVQPQLTEELVQEAQRLLGVLLPPSLLSVLCVQNGGGVAARWRAFPTLAPTSWSQDHVPFGDLMGIGRRERMTSILDSPYLVEEWGLPTPVVLLSGDGHYWTALDYRACGPQGEPSVTWFDTDEKSELALAADFPSFIEGLTATEGFDKGVQPV
ncbi:SMI1/KNR4 family protein [Streptomyces sp. NPDC102406]|uniref:SMI1/KNR4 family protein n=1 Tax=Streptomyces sp. NPDC102406 TaxID=3366171 RepID=UPI0037F1B5B6